MALEVRRAAPFSTEIRGTESHALVILTGELDVSTAGQLYEELATLNREGAIHVALDLTALEYIDSTGISVIIAEHKRTSSAGGGVDHPDAAPPRSAGVRGLRSDGSAERPAPERAPNRADDERASLESSNSGVPSTMEVTKWK